MIQYEHMQVVAPQGGLELVNQLNARGLEGWKLQFMAPAMAQVSAPSALALPGPPQVQTVPIWVAILCRPLPLMECEHGAGI